MSQQNDSTSQAQSAGCVCGGKGPALSQMINMMMPAADTASEHFRNAGIEFLKGFRELIDQRIDSLQRKSTATASSQGTKFSVD
ncbi:hypothetical protein F183_A09180 [Bryobacterales bacterium F-183]|nr:hypothetical protein F183_A09180 [Bryobacterales bacterium F-183]